MAFVLCIHPSHKLVIYLCILLDLTYQILPLQAYYLPTHTALPVLSIHMCHHTLNRVFCSEQVLSVPMLRSLVSTLTFQESTNIAVTLPESIELIMWDELGVF